MKSSKFWIGGKHAVKAAFANLNRNIFEIYTTKENEFFCINNIEKRKNKIKITVKDNKSINKLFKNNIAHQGVAALVEKTKMQNLNWFLENAKNKQSSLIIILDNITDQRNIGSIIRSCVAFRVDAVFTLKQNFNPENESMIKSASGGIDLIPIISVSNITNLITELKKNKYWIVGLDLNTKNDLFNYNWLDKTAIVLGSEGSGMRRLVKEHCDDLLKININPEINSLNVSNALTATLSIVTFKKKTQGF